MISYKLCKKLKDAGFPQKVKYGDSYWQAEEIVACDPRWTGIKTEEYIKIPTLSELIKECGDQFSCLAFQGKKWIVNNCSDYEPYEVGIIGKSPEQAVAKLWLKLKK